MKYLAKYVETIVYNYEFEADTLPEAIEKAEYHLECGDCIERDIDVDTSDPRSNQIKMESLTKLDD